MPANSAPANIVHFGIGSDFGAFLTDLARERLLYNGDVEGAVSCICEALIGCSREIAVYREGTVCDAATLCGDVNVTDHAIVAGHVEIRGGLVLNGHDIVK